MTTRSAAALVACALALPGVARAQALPAHQRANPWFVAGAVVVETRATEARSTGSSSAAGRGRARGAILFVGDGMDLSTLAAARILDGQRRGEPGEGNALSFERFGHTALVRTYTVDAQVPDPAGAMTAMVTGVKSGAGTLGVDADAVPGDCASVAGNELAGALELAELRGLATGLVTTGRLTEAAPAAAYATSADARWESDRDLPPGAVAAGCTDAASQLAAFSATLRARHPDAGADGLDVVLGGGRRGFLPATGERAGGRADGRDLVAEWRAAHPDGTYVADAAALAALDAGAPGPVLGLFADARLGEVIDRSATEPSLAAMVGATIGRLSRDPDGYLLVVHSADVARAHRAGNAHGALAATIALAEAVAVADAATDPAETLILVTAGHGSTLSFGGYAKRGNPILGTVVPPRGFAPVRAADGRPFTTLGYRDGPGFADLSASADPDARRALDPAPGRHDLEAVDTVSPGFHQEALVPLPAASRGGADVSLHARGPGAARVRGTLEQNAVFHALDAALGLSGAGR